VKSVCFQYPIWRDETQSRRTVGTNTPRESEKKKDQEPREKKTDGSRSQGRAESPKADGSKPTEPTNPVRTVRDRERPSEKKDSEDRIKGIQKGATLGKALRRPQKFNRK